MLAEPRSRSCAMSGNVGVLGAFKRKDPANQTMKPSGLNSEEIPAMSLPAAVAKALLGVLLVLASLGGAVTALEWVAPPPGKRYANLPRAPAVPIFPDADHPNPPCFAP